MAGLIGLYIILSSFITPIIVVVVATLVGITYIFWVIPIVAAVSALLVAGMYLLYVKWVFHEWEKAFTGHRMTRRGESCPSNQQLPDVKSLKQNKARILENAKLHENFDDCQLLHAVEQTKLQEGKYSLSS